MVSNLVQCLQIKKLDFNHKIKKLSLLQVQDNMKLNKNDQTKNLKLNIKKINDKQSIDFAFHQLLVFLHMSKFLVMMKLLQVI